MRSDYGYSVQQTSDGGYIVTGNTWSFGDSGQVYLVKTNEFGDTLWTRTYGGTNTDYAYSVQQTSDGGYIVAGYTGPYGSYPTQVYLIKTYLNGDTIWTRTYGGAGYDEGYSVQQTTDGGYIVAGSRPSDQIYLIKTDAIGDTLWSRTYGGGKGYCVQQTLDLGYIITGSGSQVYLIKTDASGNALWTQTYGGTGVDEGYSVQQTSDGGYIIAGQTYSFGNDSQVYLIKTDASGDTLWTRTYGGTDYDIARSVRQTPDGGYIVGGWTWSFGNNSQVYLIKTNPNGDTLWTRTCGGSGFDAGWSIHQTLDGGYIVGGWTRSFGNSEQVYLIKTDANGNVGVEERPDKEFKSV